MRQYAERTWGCWVPEPRSQFRPEICQIIQADDRDIGYMALDEQADALMLEKFYVLSSHRNRGIGTFLLHRLVNRAHSCAKPIRLRVLRVNTAATALYARHGFRIDRSTDERHFMSYSVEAGVIEREKEALALLPIGKDALDRHVLFDLYKISLRELIDQTFGWDEHFQQNRFDTSYLKQELLSITLGPTSIGYVAMKQETDSIHLSLLLLQPAYQNKGFGKQAMETLLLSARSMGKKMTLCCFTRNAQAMRFYRRLGFTTIAEDEHFVTLRSPLPVDGI